MSGGTEAFPELGRHCQHPDCHQLDFLPFKCAACHVTFCLDHRSYASHNCPKSDHNSRKVIVCNSCSTSIETTGLDDREETLLERHGKSGSCDPSKKEKLKCPVKRCKEKLTFSNSSTCKSCNLKVCLGHRFPADHECGKQARAASAVGVAATSNGGGLWNGKFLAAYASRNGQDCGKSERGSRSPTKTSSVRVFLNFCSFSF